MTVLYIFFKFWYKSKIIPLDAMDLKTEFEAIRREKEEEAHLGSPADGKFETIVAKIRNWI